MVRRGSGEAPRRRWSAGAGDFVVDESPARSSLRQFSSHVRRTTVVAAKARLSRKMGDALAAGEDHEKEMSDNLWRHHRLLLPTSRRKDQWDVFVLLLVLWNCVYIPLQMAFQVRNAVHTTAQDYVLTAVDYLIDVAFLVDIGVNFRTTFYNSHHELVIEPRAIALRYLRQWFFLDLIATFPFEVFALGATENLLLFDACKAPRLFRLIRFVKRFDKLTGANVLRLLWLFMWYAARNSSAQFGAQFGAIL